MKREVSGPLSVQLGFELMAKQSRMTDLMKCARRECAGDLYLRLIDGQLDDDVHFLC